MNNGINRRQFGLMAGALAASTILAGTGARAAPSGRLVVGTWGGDYQNLQQQFIVDAEMKGSGINVVFDTANDTVRKTKLLAERRLPRGSMDIACLTGQGAYEMNENGVLEELDETKVPNLKHVPAAFRNNYSAPHIYTGRVILYNPKFVKTPPTSYADLWDPQYAGKVGVIDIQYQTTIESAAMIAGGGIDNYEPGKEKLLELKKQGVKIYPTNEAMAQALKTEECVMCIMWNARGYMWKQAGIPIEIAVPKEGLVLYTSEMCVPKNAPNKEAAYAYLNAMMETGPQTAFAKSMGYAPTNSTVELEPELAKQVDYTKEQRESMMVQNMEYLAENDAALQDWWNKSFKG
ncbi:MAG TPA: ABC transporter substrate-binding protein [Tianweitania sediminis]|jgi:putative spermidine/putrescine transport system substrate-binding protein|nr:ABC transporter substrate-binding protein [Tianweitania sediminis]